MDYVSSHVPELTLALAGIVMLLIVYTYLRNKEGAAYKLMIIIGVLLGAGMVLMLVEHSDQWYFFGTAVITVAAFALIIRPFKDTNFAIVIAALVMVIVYIYLGDVTGDFEPLSEGWPRIIVSVVAGSIVYMILNFIQTLAQMIGKILNWWPILAVFGLVCIAEGVLVLTGGPSLLDIYHDYEGTKTVTECLFC